MNDLVEIAKAYGFELESMGSGMRGTKYPWTCIIGKNLTDHGDEWILYDHLEHRYGGKSPLEFASILERAMEWEDEDMMTEISRKHGWLG